MINNLLNIVLILIFISTQAFPQQDNPDYPWQKLYSDDKIEIKFIFYSKADNYNNGIVIKLKNNLDTKLEYKFTLIFRSLKSEATENLSGVLEPNQIITGSSKELFFVPFPDGSSISELGITDIKISSLK